MFLQLMSVMFAGYLAWAAWITVGMIDFIQSTRAGTYVSQAGLFDDAEPIEEMALIVERSSAGLYTFCVIAYLLFVYVAASNLENARATGFKRSPNGAVLLSFIPIANFVLIFMIMRDIWVSSNDPQRGVEAPSNLLPFWWMTFLIGGVGGSIVTYASLRAMDAGNVDQAIGFTWISVGATALVAISCVLLVLIVHGITQAQSRWRDLPAA